MATVTNIADAEIARLLNRGDVEAACRLAAKLPKPAHYLAAMQRINEIISSHAQRKGHMEPMFSLEEKQALLTHYEADKRVSDDPEKDAQAIAVVSFALTLPSELLAGFSPTLRAALFHMNGAVTHDLANMTQDAPDVRFADWIYPIKIKKSWEGAQVTIHKGLGGKSDLVLSDAAISTFHVTPKSGSVFILEFTARSKPDSSTVFGKLADMLKTNVTISLAPPEAPSGDVDALMDALYQADAAAEGESK